MQGRRGILGSSNGNLDASILFVAEAPGRLGADRFGIPLYGDQTGQNFETLISCAGLSRESLFITNAVLCNPRTQNGNNDSPTLSEIRNCSGYLKDILDIVNPKYVVPLGRIALLSLNCIKPHQMKLSEDVGKVFGWNGCLVYPLFHPGPRALVRRTRAQQIMDYECLARLVDVF